MLSNLKSNRGVRQAQRPVRPERSEGTGVLDAAERSDATCIQNDSSTGPLQRLLGGTSFLVNILYSPT